MTRIFACTFAGVLLASGVGMAKDPPPKKLKRAPTRIAVPGTTLELEAKLWLDAAAAETPLKGHLKLKTDGTASIPAGLQIDRVWLIRKKEVWSPEKVEANVAYAEPGKPRAVMDIEFGGGPKWAAGTKIICVVRIELTDGSMGMLKAGKIAIAANP